MKPGGPIRAWLRPLGRLFHRWGDALDGAPAPRAPKVPAKFQGAPEHWLELVRQHAPHLLEEDGTAAMGTAEPEEATAWPERREPQESTRMPSSTQAEVQEPNATPLGPVVGAAAPRAAHPVVEASGERPPSPPTEPRRGPRAGSAEPPAPASFPSPRPVERVATERRRSPLLARRATQDAPPANERTRPARHAEEPWSSAPADHFEMQTFELTAPRAGDGARRAPPPSPEPAREREPRREPPEATPIAPWPPTELLQPAPRHRRPLERPPAAIDPYPSLPRVFAEGPRPRAEEPRARVEAPRPRVPTPATPLPTLLPAADRWPSLPDVTLDEGTTGQDLERLIGRIRREERERGEP